MSAVGERAAGHPPAPVTALWVGLDVGGTKIEGAAVDSAGVARGTVLLPTDVTSTGGVVESIAAALEELLAAARANPSAGEPMRVAGVGLGIPGKVQDGVVSLAVNLNLESYPLGRVLAERFGVPVYLENDVRAAALGAYAWLNGAGQPGPQSLVYLSLGTGISAGVILDGRLHRGVGGMAGEVGHAVLDPAGARCKCGMRGCFETVAAGPAIARQGQEAAARAFAHGQHTCLLEANPLTAEAVFAAARAGDSVAMDVVRRVAWFVARAVYNLLMYYDVELVALGGGVSHAGEVFFNPVREELARLVEESPLAREMLSAKGAGRADSAGRAEKVILLPPDASPAWRGMVLLAQSMAEQ